MLNKVTLIGNAVADPETKQMPNGNAVTNLRFATSRRWKDSNNVKQTETEYHRIVFFNRLAEVVGELVKKGKQLYIEGRIKTTKYTDQGGNDKYSTEIIGSEMQMLGRRDDQQAPNPQYSSGSPDLPDDDIPF